MAYAAVSAVLFAIYDFVETPRVSLAASTRESLQSAYDEAESLKSTLSVCSGVATAADERIIIEEARRLNDAVDFAVLTQFLERPRFPRNFNHLKQDLECFARVAQRMIRRIEKLWEQKVAKMIEEHIAEICLPQKEEEEDVSPSATNMVGLADEIRALRDFLTGPPVKDFIQSFYRIVFWISGMAGVGKTTLAVRVYHNPLVKVTFECRAFVRVGREYRIERVLRAIIAQLNRGDKKMMRGGDDEDLRESLRTALTFKRCLVVLDDVWDDVLENLFGRDPIWGGCESWILVTSRMALDFPYKFNTWKFRFLNEEESWELLKRKVFDEEEQVCPPLLVEAGKKIAKKCEGLPLLINAVAPILLLEADHDPESWNRISKRPNSILEEASNQISEVLLSSYYKIDEKYKLYFLYIAAFPLSHVVFCSKIINLWHAEGFYHFTWDKVKSRAFKELVLNSLVITDEERSWSSGETKACSLHCAYWYICKRVAKDNKFLYILNSYADGMDESMKSHHRLAIQTNVLFSIKEVSDEISSISTIRSVLCTGLYLQYQVPIVCCEWKVLKVLDALTIRFYEFPAEVVKLILLRYLALTCNADLPPSISKLWRLRYLIVNQHSRIRKVAADESYVPVEVWDLKELIHLEIMGRNLPHPPHPGVILPNLTKLLDVGVESCTKQVLENTPKLKKLRIQIELAPNAAETLICFDHISCMRYLKSFQSLVMNPALLGRPPPLSIPIVGLGKLSLSGFGYPWEEMSKISKLPNLYVLKLRSYAFRGEKWEANEEMRFRNLHYLYIEDTDMVQWNARGNIIMPRLQRLTMKNCHKLHEIPRSLSTLLKIELVDCNPLAESCAKLIYEFVTASYSWKKKKLSSAHDDFHLALGCWI